MKNHITLLEIPRQIIFQPVELLAWLNIALIFNTYSIFLLFFQDAHIKRVCSQVFSSFPDFVQLSKDAAFETISDPKYSGKMKVNPFLRRKNKY